MKTKFLATGVALAAFGATAASPAIGADEAPSASEQCKTLRTQMGAQTFADAYGTNANKKNAFGKCVSALNKADDDNAANANKTCKTEQAADEKAFADKYGTGKNKRNAFGKCVSGQKKAEVKQDTKTQLNAAKTCKAERKADPTAFKLKYGTNKNKSNAFGKCVSAAAKAKPKPEPTPEPTPTATATA